MVKDPNISGVYFEVSSRKFIMGNSFLEIQIDKKTGCIINLINKVTRHQYLSENSDGPFRIYYNSMVTSVWKATSANILFKSFDQQVMGYRVEEASGNSKILYVEYEHLLSEGKSYNISVTYSIHIYPNTAQTFWDIKIVNKDRGVIRQIDFPFFKGIGKTFEENGLENYLLIPTCGGGKIKDPINRFNRDERVVLEYPAMGSMQWMELGNVEEGLYLASLDKSISYTQLVFGKEGDTPFIQISKFPFLAPDSEWASHLYAVGIHKGDWHWSADRYREWLESWCEKPYVPKWVQELPGIHWTHIVLQGNKLVRTFKDLPNLFDNLQSCLGRPPVLYIHGWWEGGFDTNLPEYIVSSKAGGAEELKLAIDYIHSKGGKVIFYFNGRVTDVNTQTYRAHGHHWAVIDQNGEERHEQYGLLNAVVNCPSVQEWRDTLLNYTLNAIREFDIDGMHYDQIGCAWARLCYNPAHNHSTPATAWAEYRNFLKFHREAQNRLKRDMFYSTEEFVDAFTPYFNWGFDWMGNSPQLGLFPFLRSRLGEYFPELTRYTMPWFITSGPWHFENMPFNMNAYNFVLGKRFNYGDDPASISSILPYIEMYELAKDAFYHGRFMDDIGLTIQQPTSSNVLGKVHIGKNSTVIALWNNGSETCSVKVRLNLSRLNLTREIGSVIDLGVKVGFRNGCENIPFTVKDDMLEFEVFNLEPQKATSIKILPTKPSENDLKIQSLKLLKSEIIRGEKQEIDITVMDSLTGDPVSEANVTVFVNGLTLQGDEINKGEYKVTIETKKSKLEPFV